MRSTFCPACGRAIVMDDSQWTESIECARCKTTFSPVVVQRLRDVPRENHPETRTLPPGEVLPPVSTPASFPATVYAEEAPPSRQWGFALTIFLAGAAVLTGVVLLVVSKAKQRQAEIAAQRRQPAEAKSTSPERPVAAAPAQAEKAAPQPPNGLLPQVRPVTPVAPDPKKHRLESQGPGGDSPPPDPAPAAPTDPVADAKLRKLIEELGTGSVDRITKAAEEIGKYGDRATDGAARSLCYHVVNSGTPAVQAVCDRAFFRVRPKLYHLMIGVRDRDPEARLENVEEIIRLGSQAAPLAPALAKRIAAELTSRLPDSYLAPRCFQAMVICSPDDPATASTALWLARSRHDIMRRLAFEAMGEVGAGRPAFQKDFRAALERARKDQSQEVRDAVQKAMEMLK